MVLFESVREVLAACNVKPRQARSSPLRLITPCIWELINRHHMSAGAANQTKTWQPCMYDMVLGRTHWKALPVCRYAFRALCVGESEGLWFAMQPLSS